MTEPNKPGNLRRHTVAWSLEDWSDIELVTRLKADESHMDTTPADIIRAATRKYCHDLLANPAEHDGVRRVGERRAVPDRRGGERRLA